MPRADEPVRPPAVPRNMAVPLRREPPRLRFIPNGQVILWSVGEDIQDDGGKRQGIHRQSASFGDDLIYLVPPPPGSARE